MFPEHPEFYATYKLLNVKSHMLYSDKLQLSVLDLTRIDLATTEDREDYYRRMQGMDDMLAEMGAALAKKRAALAEKDDTINEQAALIADLKAQLARYEGTGDNKKFHNQFL